MVRLRSPSPKSRSLGSGRDILLVSASQAGTFLELPVTPPQLPDALALRYCSRREAPHQKKHAPSRTVGETNSLSCGGLVSHPMLSPSLFLDHTAMGVSPSPAPPSPASPSVAPAPPRAASPALLGGTAQFPRARAHELPSLGRSGPAAHLSARDHL